MMMSNPKKYYSKRIFAIAFSLLVVMSLSFIFVGLEIIPDKLNSEVSQFCIKHLKDKSYQIKQTLLENANNSKLWIQNRQNTFFDSKWFAISYYEHDGKEWVLKDFKLNNLVIDIYKIAQSEYIKSDQRLTPPSPGSQQMNLHESKIGEIPVLVMDIPNHINTISSNHLIRITLFTDLFLSTLNSDEKCQLSLMDTRGNFLLKENQINEQSFLQTLQNKSQATVSPEVNKMIFEKRDVFSYKFLKNTYMMAFVRPRSNTFLSAFIQITSVNFVILLLMLLVGFSVIYRNFTKRITNVNSNIRKVSNKDYHLNFDLSKEDELSSVEEEVSRLADELRRNKKS